MPQNNTWKTNMTLENQPFEDASPIKHGDFPLLCEFSVGNPGSPWPSFLEFGIGF